MAAAELESMATAAALLNAGAAVAGPGVSVLSAEHERPANPTTGADARHRLDVAAYDAPRPAEAARLAPACANTSTETPAQSAQSSGKRGLAKKRQANTDGALSDRSRKHGRQEAS